MSMNNYVRPKPSITNTYTINNSINNNPPLPYSYNDCYDIHKKLNNIQREVEKLNYQKENNATCIYILYNI